MRRGMGVRLLAVLVGLCLLTGMVTYGGEGEAAAAPSPATPSVAGGPARYAYDAAGRLVGVTRPGGETTRYAYDSAGNLTGTERFASDRLSVLSVVPPAARPGDTVTISGTGFSATAGGNTVRFGGTAGTVTAASATRLSVRVPAGVRAGEVTVTAGATTATGERFRPVPLPDVDGAKAGSRTRITVGAPTQQVPIEEPGESALVLFAAPASGRVDIGVTDSTAGDAQLLVFDSDDNLIADGFAFSGAGAVHVDGLTEGSDYQLVIDPFEDLSGTVEVTLSEPVTGTLTATGPEVATSWDRPGQGALLSFTGTGNGAVSFGFTDNTFFSFVCVKVRAPDGSEVGVEECLNPFFDQDVDVPALPAGGTYQLALSSPFAETGSLTVTLSNRVVAGALAVGGGAVPATITRPGQDAAYTFSGSTGQRLRLHATGVASFANFVGFWVYLPDGLPLSPPGFLGADGDLDIEDLPESGTYTLVVDPENLATGQVEVSLATRTTPFTGSAELHRKATR